MEDASIIGNWPILKKCLGLVKKVRVTLAYPGSIETASELASYAQEQVSFSFDPIVSPYNVKLTCSMTNTAAHSLIL